MKKFMVMFLTVLLAAAMLAGCRTNVPQDTTGSIAPGTTPAPTTAAPPSSTPAPSGTQGGETVKAVELLQTVWEKFGKGFAAYGGSLENAVDGAPGALDVTAVEEMTTRYLIPQQQLASVAEAASLVHMMNSNIFTTVSVKIADGTDVKTVAEAWRNAIQGNTWICGQPDRLLLADVGEGYLIMAFGSADLLTPYANKLSEAYTQAKTLYNEAIVA